ncbi:MAG: TPM domain-containing protein [Solobacterium sp.]|nr:TPM domain-containing protein [Solobacterium sp.]
MKKVLLPAVISLMMGTLAVPVLAQGDEFILDYDGYLTAAQKAELNEEAQEILQETGYSVLLLLDETNTGSLIDYAVSEYNAHAPSADGIMLAVDSDEYYVYSAGSAAQYIDAAQSERIWNAFLCDEDIYECVDEYLDYAEELFEQHRVPARPTETYAERMTDFTGKLDGSQLTALIQKMDAVSTEHGITVAGALTDTLDGMDVQTYADQFFDLNGLGYGPTDSGVLLLISEEDREFALSTKGKAIGAFTNAGQEYLIKQLKSDMSKGNYYKVFDAYTDLADQFLVQAETGKPYDKGNLPKKALSLIWIPLSLLLGALGALLPTGAMKSQLKSVYTREKADSYVVKDSVNIGISRNRLIDTVISRRKIDQKTSSKGSETHTTDGQTHGGTHGKF